MIYLSPIMLTFIISIGLSLLLMDSVEAPHKRKPKTKPPVASSKSKPKKNNFCKGKSTVGLRYPDESSLCEYYYVCNADGHQHRNQCKKGQVFDKRTSRCEKKINGKVGCPHLQSSGVPQTAQKRTPPPQAGALIRVPQPHQRPSTHSETNRGHQPSPARNQRMDPETFYLSIQPAMKDNSFCRGKAKEGMYPDEASLCVYFYACYANGHQYRVKCEVGKVFNIGMGICEKGKGCPHQRSFGPDLPPSTQQSQTKEGNFCIGKSTGYHLDERTNCRNAYLCKADKIQYEYQCKEGEVFNMYKQTCEQSIHGKGCPQTGRAPPLYAPAVTGPVSTFPVLTVPAHAVRGLNLPVQTVPARKTTLLIADTSHHTLQFCKGKRAGRYPDKSWPTNCKGYYICRSSNNKSIYISCSPGRVFNDNWDWCEPENAKAKGCPSPEKQITRMHYAPPSESPVKFCENLENGAHPDTDNGNKFYYYCDKSQGYFVRRSCQPGWVFTVIDNKCTPM